MSILIKGMKKPKACGLCRLCLDDSRIANGYCMIFHRAVNMTEIDKKCPLVEVPEPHGRLIDADKILDKMKSMMVQGEAFTTAVKYVELIVDDAPTVIEAEEGEDECKQMGV